MEPVKQNVVESIINGINSAQSIDELYYHFDTEIPATFGLTTWGISKSMTTNHEFEFEGRPYRIETTVFYGDGTATVGYIKIFISGALQDFLHFEFDTLL